MCENFRNDPSICVPDHTVENNTNPKTLADVNLPILSDVDKIPIAQFHMIMNAHRLNKVTYVAKAM